MRTNEPETNSIVRTCCREVVLELGHGMKKAKSTRVIREAGKADVPLKVWNKKNLTRKDWDFSDLLEFSAEMLRVAWLYEVDRELGSGNPPYFVAWELNELRKRKAKLLADLDGTHPLSLIELKALLPEIPPDKTELEAEAELKQMREGKPEMTLGEEAEYRKKDGALGALKEQKLDKLVKSEVKAKVTSWKPPIPIEPKLILKSHPYEGLLERIPRYCQWADGSGHHSTIHPLEIDWTLTETELVEAFRNWLRDGDHSPLRPSYKQMANPSKVGKRRTAGWLTNLKELAIYRISEAQFTRLEGLAVLGMKPFGKENKPAISAANWEHAQARTRERIKKEKKRCEHFAWDQGQGSPENWRNCFVNPFRL